MTIQIRQARIEDLNSVVAIELENFSPKEAMSFETLAEHIKKNKTSFLVAEKDGHILGYLEGPVVPWRYLQDSSFEQVEDFSHNNGGYISITSLSISPDAQSMGLGKILIDRMKEIAQRDGRLGINLTCHDYLITYYEKHGFINEGLSKSTYAGEVWYDLIWEVSRQE